MKTTSTVTVLPAGRYIARVKKLATVLVRGKRHSVLELDVVDGHAPRPRKVTRRRRRAPAVAAAALPAAVPGKRAKRSLAEVEA